MEAVRWMVETQFFFNQEKALALRNKLIGLFIHEVSFEMRAGLVVIEAEKVYTTSIHFMMTDVCG